MPRDLRYEEEEDWSVPEDDAFDDGDETALCPYCRSLIHEDTPRCPECGHYLSREDAPPAAKPWWVVVGALACLYVVFRWTFLH